MSIVEEMYDNFANAIVLQACNDYFICKRALEEGKRGWNKISNCQKTLDEAIEFFNSSWYKKLTHHNENLTGQKVMKRLDAMVEDREHYPSSKEPFNTHAFE